jgi:hypothetical protein
MPIPCPTPTKEGFEYTNTNTGLGDDSDDILAISEKVISNNGTSLLLIRWEFTEIQSDVA